MGTIYSVWLLFNVNSMVINPYYFFIIKMLKSTLIAPTVVKFIVIVRTTIMFKIVIGSRTINLRGVQCLETLNNEEEISLLNTKRIKSVLSILIVQYIESRCQSVILTAELSDQHFCYKIQSLGLFSLFLPLEGVHKRT